METRDLFKEGEPLASPPVFALKSDLQAGDPEEIPVQVEHVLRVFVNEVHTMTLTCSPDHLTKQQGLVLVCGARPDKMLVYSDPAGGVASLG